jgi:hypothetical protein
MKNPQEIDSSEQSGAVEGRETSLPTGGLAVHLLSMERLLPPRCPLCAAPGVVGHSIGLSGANLEEHERPSVEVHYCDICAEGRSRALTREISLKAAAIVVVLASATSLSLLFGTRLVLHQVLAMFLLTCALLLLQRSRLWSTPRQGIWLLPRGSADPPGTLRVLSEVPKFAACLSQQGLLPAPFESGEAKRIPARRELLFPSVVGLLGLIWLLLVQTLGVAQVRILVGGDESATLLVDSRKVAVVKRANSEDPRAGGIVKVMGGQRAIELITRGGRPVAQAKVTIWPGRTYIVGYLPTDHCLFWEELNYGDKGRRHRLNRLRGSGPIWELDRAVDSWFMPLAAEGDEEENTPSTSGGTRQAIRLLPCGAFRAPGAL